MTNKLGFTKTIIPPALMASESIAIDSEAMRAGEIIVNYSLYILLSVLPVVEISAALV